MRGQLFGLGNADDVVGSFQELRFRIVDKARFLIKSSTESGEETRRAAGGQHVVWTREVIAERLRRIVSEEHGTGVIELADVFERIFTADFKVLGGASSFAKSTASAMFSQTIIAPKFSMDSLMMSFLESVCIWRSISAAVAFARSSSG